MEFSTAAPGICVSDGIAGGSGSVEATHSTGQSAVVDSAGLADGGGLHTSGAAGVDVGAGVGVAVDDDVDGVDSIGVGAVTAAVDPEGVAKSSSNFFMVIIKLRLAH